MKLENLHYSLSDVQNESGEFDLEKWREEYPIDYYKAMWLLVSLPNADSCNGMQDLVRDEVFKTIYRIVRMYIPDTLYKYYSFAEDERLNEVKLETLKKQQLYLSDIQSFNDPFDAKAFYYDPEPLKTIQRLKPHDGRLIDDFTAFIRATSLTANGVQSMPMWAHYANNHTGFCVAYDMKDKANLTLSSCTFPVQYTDQRLDITSLMLDQAQMLSSEIERQSQLGQKEILIDDLSVIYASLLLCNIKHTSWSYENEFRCTIGALNPHVPYVEGKPKAIYVGMKCSDEHKKQLKNIASELQISIFQMGFDELSESYELSITEV